MNGITSGAIGILLGIVIVMGIQATCYKFIAYENYHKAVIIALTSAFLGILATLLIVNIAK